MDADFRMEEVHCNICGGTDVDTVYESRWSTEVEQDAVETYRASGDELLLDRLVRCRRCGLEYINPRPHAGDIVSAYSEGDDPTYVSQVKARERTFGRALAEIESLQRSRGRLLDVGTAAGAFLSVARDRGWHVDGCEPNRWLAEWGSRQYGLNIRAGDLFDHDFPEKSYDVVTLWDVIEHTPDPSSVIERVRTLLRPGGLLVVNYPDRGSWIARLLGRNWPFLSSVHLYYFTRSTMARLLGSNGFEIVRMRPHFQQLQLDYLLSRVEVINWRLSMVARTVARWLGVSDYTVYYWIGQTFVAARLGSFALALSPAAGL